MTDTLPPYPRRLDNVTDDLYDDVVTSGLIREAFDLVELAVPQHLELPSSALGVAGATAYALVAIARELHNLSALARREQEATR